MMKCKYCGEAAGFLKLEHPQCREAIENGKKYIRECIDYIYTNRDCMNIQEVISDTVRRYRIPQRSVKPLLLECWNAKAADAFQDGVIDNDEIKILREMLLPLGITQSEIKNSEQGKKLFEYGQRAILQTLNSAIKDRNLTSLRSKVEKIANAYGLDDSLVKKNVMHGWTQFLDDAFDDGILDEEEEELLDQLGDIFLLTTADIAPYKERIVKGAVLRDVLSGVVPHRLTIANQLPVMLQKQESVIWLFNHVDGYEDKMRRHYTAGSSGVSVHVAKGIYLRSGAFKGYPVETAETVHMGSGCLIITNKHIFWVSASKSIKIPVKKIVTIMPNPQGVIIQKDGVAAKPQTFVTDDPWFAYNLISNLNLLQ